TICAFEYIYFARADSVIDKLSVYESRINVGKRLWEESPIDADIVIGVPESGTTAAIGFSIASGIPYDIGFVKNQYIGRTFIEPLQEKRETNLEIKLSVIRSSVEGKRIVVVDDSIVRGTTSKKIVALLRKAGAKEIHFRSASPIIKYPCFWGINTPDRSELLGSSNTVDEIKELIGADSLKYVSIDGLIKSLGNKITCLKCFLNKEKI
ncbi:MAG: phosphoribosyltransferase family protein, partial [Clostridium sp.]|nr:phosphoribosyltransferase family protein [Clostridium sp.]